MNKYTELRILTLGVDKANRLLYGGSVYRVVGLKQL